MSVIPFDKRKSELQEVVLKKKGPVIYVDFALVSMVKSVENWYNEYYQTDPWKILQKAHTYHIIRFYDYTRFTNHETIGKERSDYLTEVDLYVQMKRED
jgi:hypothetical protein